MQRRFKGKHVIVTGAGTGLGRATTYRFLSEGAEVLLLGRREQVLEDVVRPVNNDSAWWIATDITKTEHCRRAIDAAVERWGKIDVLVNNAGVDSDGYTPFLQTTTDLWDRVMNTNLRGAFVMSQLVSHVMVKHGGGVILHNASICSVGGEIGSSSYCCSKAGLVSLTQTMAIELATYGIRVNCVSPGWIHTEMTEKVMTHETLKHLQTNFERVPIRRLGLPEEIAAVFAFLASDDASLITGQNIIVDGGITANLYVLETFSQKDSILGDLLAGRGPKDANPHEFAHRHTRGESSSDRRTEA
jgi:NAD(P)-dependent dehydrogenase (short-subunit alcohol dehydrogenase family)